MLTALSDSQAVGPLPFAIVAFAGLCCLASITEIGARLQHGLGEPAPAAADMAGTLAGHIAHAAILGAALVFATFAVLRAAIRGGARG